MVSAQSSVWKVEGNGNTLYMGGTVHILRPDDYPLPEAFESTYKQIETLVFEADIGQLEDPALQQQMMAKSMYTDDRTLKSVLDEETYAALEKECNAVGLPLAMMQKLKPAVVVLTVSLMKMQSIQISSDGVDKHFYNYGLKDEKPIEYLETVDEQISIITDLGEGNENEFVKYSLESFDEMEKELYEMIDAWKSGDPTSLESQIVEMEEEYPDVYAVMLKDRNNNWMPKMEEFMEDKDVEFVLVGTLHLYGKDGLIEQMRAAGYKVTQIQ